MFLKTFVSLIVCLDLIFSEAAFVDTIKKCSIQDKECLKTNFCDILGKMSKTGIPEYDIPPIDPFEVKNESVSILDLMTLTITDAKFMGIKNCDVDKFIINLDKERGSSKLICNLTTMEGKYELVAKSPILKDVFREDIHGKGQFKIQMEKIILNFKFPIYAQKREGEIYLDYDYDHTIFEYKILENPKIIINNLFIGKEESSKVFMDFFNENWKLIESTFGKPIVDRSLVIAFDIFSKFFNFIPAKYFISDDLSSYAKP